MPTWPVDDGPPADLHLIDLDQDLVGQRRFISCWVRTGAPAFLVDPGPPSTGDHLLAELDALGLDRLDFILLTHIHLDHAGTTARLLERWPAARVVCHPRGRAHLVDPERLWAGSLQVLGEKARLYGEPLPVPESALAEYAEAEAAGIRVIETPGHAPHHVCFVFEGTLFAGEAAGTFSSLGCGDDCPEPYLRPATPPMFKLEVATASLTKLLALEPAPERAAFAHHGLFSGDVPWLLGVARGQLELWVRVGRETAAALGGLPAAEDRVGLIRWMDATAAVLLERDEFFARGAALPGDIREREREFTRQTLWGMAGYLRG